MDNEEYRKRYDIPNNVEEEEIQEFMEFMKIVRESTTNHPDEDFFDDRYD